MTIRDATETDLPAIVEIYNASIPGRMATADTERISVDSRRDWFRDHVPGNGATLNLFESFGFQRRGVLPGNAELDGIERDLIILGRRLSDLDQI